MWKLMLTTELLEIQMNELEQLFELKLRGGKRKQDTAVVRLNQADLIQLVHILLEINRTFRGDVPYFSPSVTVLEKSTSIVS
jgi:hypothetical protein